MKTFQDIIVGAGQAGPFLAGQLANAGRSVAIVERKAFGGTCVNTGCTPTKTMIASAKIAHHVRDAQRYGIHVDGQISILLSEVRKRADEIVMQSRTGLEKMLQSLPNCTIIRGSARFLSANSLQVGDDALEGERIFLNVGGRASVPPMLGIDDIPFLTNSTLLKLERLPEHLMIVGGGYVGVEFAQMFQRLGSRVTIVEMGPRLVSHEDEDVSEAIAQLLRDEAIEVRLNAECIAFSRHEQNVRVHVSCRSGSPEIIGSDVLLAVGRIPNTDDLGLDAAGVLKDDRGYIIVNDRLQTNVAHIYAMGDCNRRGAFTHTAYNDFEIVAANLLNNDDRRISDRIQTHALFTDPPLAQVGMTEVEVRRSGKKALMATRPMSRVGRAVEKGEPFGFMKVLVDAETEQILGASILGTGADEAIHSILDTMYAKAPYTVLQRAVHIHPTVAELIPTLLGELRPLA